MLCKFVVHVARTLVQSIQLMHQELEILLREVLIRQALDEKA
jgi:hypothetical protein